MSDDKQSGEKTEDPTDKRLRDARKKGQVAKSADVSSTWLLIVMFVYFAMFKYILLEKFKELVLLPTVFMSQPFEEALPQVVAGMISLFLLLTVPMLLLVAIMGIFINFLQTGPVFSVDPMKPDMKKLNPAAGLKRIFSKKGLVEVLKNTLKTIFLGIVLYYVIKNTIQPLMLIPFSGLNAIFAVMIPVFKNFAISVSMVYIVVAVADLLFQRWQYKKDLMMTKDEVKREYKEMEGDPLIKGERRQLHEELAMSDNVEAVKKSSALITNPTEYAIAIYYEEGKVLLPMVMAKGKGHMAKKMIETALENDIPIMRDVPLAHSLYQQTPEFHYIPEELIEPVAAVLVWAKSQQSASDM
ncbi:MAG: EscU/YscU/HrcU family type III secretion system export apparatus switch protein [Verrucomicrobia bacterium CG_4_10_14_3_um_filter_43_23]|nr:MAG: hypothetical protein AUJ82_00330 [Verrucomicrobia bacterium CG1_02_43_26]PIP59279.1 MAG: EscU/YscU/HrcU family type III secretion system export apparatus switch protein [Verrucomicrobia bacterium CG22_combo_CG10-13_8_21_14_all_43_17]PIX57935.1 MAG: EscU/YscU/HrcU family type III secretion system export apparatus switch protein [Verrucomicrobia bacterium CG_4_10_14_3_um_filter_43_23]PIY61739.1 MAG: EscU/YscU/HrcU family type III secretion system export apparatus switch protein [Verrucomic